MTPTILAQLGVRGDSTHCPDLFCETNEVAPNVFCILAQLHCPRKSLFCGNAWRTAYNPCDRRSHFTEACREAAMATMPAQLTKTQRNGQNVRRRKLSRLQKPNDMSLEAWQRELRREFGRGQSFRIKNVGEHAVFSDFQVTNPQSQNTYRVTIRGSEAGDNVC